MNFADTIIAAAAAIIALLAFVATAWQAHLTRTHNRLSVRPVLVSHRNRVITDGGTEISLVIRNCGIGPAIVKDRFFTVAGQRFVHEGDGSREVEALAVAALGQRFNYVLRQHGLPAVNSAIPPGGEQVIATVFLPNASSSTVDNLVEAIGNVKFLLPYESLYQESYVLSID